MSITGGYTLADDDVGVIGGVSSLVGDSLASGRRCSWTDASLENDNAITDTRKTNNDRFSTRIRFTVVYATRRLRNTKSRIVLNVNYAKTITKRQLSVLRFWRQKIRERRIGFNSEKSRSKSWLRIKNKRYRILTGEGEHVLFLAGYVHVNE